MIVTRKQLQLFEILARNGYIDTPANLQFQDDSPLTEKEFRHFVLLRAALSVLQSEGLADALAKFELTEPYKP